MSMPLRYFFKEAWSSFGRGGAMSLVAVLVLTLAALSLGSYALLRQNTLYWIAKAENRFEAVVYMKDGSNQDAAAALSDRLRALPRVKDLRLVSPAEASQELSKDRGLSEFVAALNGDNPLPWSARVRLESADAPSLEAFEAEAEVLDGVDSVDWGKDSVEAVLKWLKLLRSALLALGFTLAVCAVIVTASVVRLTLYARRGEISIMRLVGAGQWFIRIPLMMEGALQGALGGLLGAALLFGAGRLIAARAMHDLQLDLGASLPYGVGPLFLLGLVLASALLGLLGSLLALGGSVREPG